MAFKTEVTAKESKFTKIPIKLMAAVLVEGQRTQLFDVVDFRSNFSINQIPTASLHVALGRALHGNSLGGGDTEPGFFRSVGEFFGMRQKAMAGKPETLLNLAQDAKIKVFLEVGRVQHEYRKYNVYDLFITDIKTDQGKIDGRHLERATGLRSQHVYKIFDGQLDAVVPSRAARQATLRLDCSHNAIALQNGSMFSWPYSGLASELFNHRILTTRRTVNGAVLKTSFLEIVGTNSDGSANVNYINFQKAKEDLWSKALKPHIEASTYQALTSKIGAGCEPYPYGNDIVKEYLGKINSDSLEGGIGDGDWDKLKVRNYDQKIDLEAGIGRLASTQGSAWSFLVNFCSQMGVAIVPTIDRLYLLPVLPIALEVYRTFTAQNISNWDFSGAALKTVSGVRVSTDARSHTTQQQKDYDAFCQYMPDDAVFQRLLKYGQIETVNLPSWLAGTLSSGISFQPVSSPPWRQPTEEEIEKNNHKWSEHREQGKLVFQQDGITDRWSRYYLLNRVFQGRNSKLQTPLRWDICPGSYVGSTVPSFSRQDEGGGGSMTMFGRVGTVSHSISTSGATTTYTLIGTMNASEYNVARNILANEHFILTGSWFGGKMDAKDNI